MPSSAIMFLQLSWTFEKEGTKLEWRWKCKPSPDSRKITSEILDFLMDANMRLSVRFYVILLLWEMPVKLTRMTFTCHLMFLFDFEVSHFINHLLFMWLLYKLYAISSSELPALQLFLEMLQHIRIASSMNQVTCRIYEISYWAFNSWFSTTSLVKFNFNILLEGSSNIISMKVIQASDPSASRKWSSDQPKYTVVHIAWLLIRYD